MRLGGDKSQRQQPKHQTTTTTTNNNNRAGGRTRVVDLDINSRSHSSRNSHTAMDNTNTGTNSSTYAAAAAASAAAFTTTSGGGIRSEDAASFFSSSAAAVYHENRASTSNTNHRHRFADHDAVDDDDDDDPWQVPPFPKSPTRATTVASSSSSSSYAGAVIKNNNPSLLHHHHPATAGITMQPVHLRGAVSQQQQQQPHMMKTSSTSPSRSRGSLMEGGAFAVGSTSGTTPSSPTRQQRPGIVHNHNNNNNNNNTTSDRMFHDWETTPMEWAAATTNRPGTGGTRSGGVAITKTNSRGSGGGRSPRRQSQPTANLVGKTTHQDTDWFLTSAVAGAPTSSSGKPAAPTIKPAAAVVADWGSVLGQQSDDSDDWNVTVRLSKSAEDHHAAITGAAVVAGAATITISPRRGGGGGGGRQPASTNTLSSPQWGTEARPIALLDDTVRGTELDCSTPTTNTATGGIFPVPPLSGGYETKRTSSTSSTFATAAAVVVSNSGSSSKALLVTEKNHPHSPGKESSSILLPQLFESPDSTSTTTGGMFSLGFGGPSSKGKKGGVGLINRFFGRNSKKNSGTSPTKRKKEQHRHSAASVSSLGENSSVSTVTNPTFATSTRDDSNQTVRQPRHTSPPKTKQNQSPKQGVSATASSLVDPFDYSAFRTSEAVPSSLSPRLAVVTTQDELANPFYTTTSATTPKESTRPEATVEATTMTARSPVGSEADENADPPDSLCGKLDSSTTCAIKEDCTGISHGEEKKDDYCDPASDEAAVFISRSGRGPPAPCPPPPPPPPMRSTTVNNNKNGTTANTIISNNNTRRLPTKSPRAFMSASTPKSPTKQRPQQQEQQQQRTPVSTSTNKNPLNLNHPLVSGSRSPVTSSSRPHVGSPRRWSSPLSSSRFQEQVTPPPTPPSRPIESPGSRSQMHKYRNHSPLNSTDRLKEQATTSTTSSAKKPLGDPGLLNSEKMRSSSLNMHNNNRRENFTESPLRRAQVRKTQQRLDHPSPEQVNDRLSPRGRGHRLSLSPSKRSGQNRSPPPPGIRRSVLSLSPSKRAGQQQIQQPPVGERSSPAIPASTSSGASGGATAASPQGGTSDSSSKRPMPVMSKQQMLQQKRSRALSQSPARASRAMSRSPTKLRAATNDAPRRANYRGASSSPIKRRSNERDVSQKLMKAPPSSSSQAQYPSPARVRARQLLSERSDKGLKHATPPRGRWDSPLKPLKQHIQAPPSPERQDPVMLNRLRAMSPTTEARHQTTNPGLSNPPVASSSYRPSPFGPRSSSPLRQPFIDTKVKDQGEKDNTKPQAATTHMVAKLCDRQRGKDVDRYGSDAQSVSSDEAVASLQHDQKKKERHPTPLAAVRSKSPPRKIPLPPRVDSDLKRPNSVAQSQLPRKPDYVKDTLDVNPTSSGDDAQTYSSCTDNSLSSVGSDIRRLRSILRRSRGNSHEVTRDSDADRGYRESLQSAFAVYTESNVDDPMHRAGLRLLSAAVIPIQTATRRFLALRAALTRMWAIVVIQAFARRWLNQSSFRKQRKAALTIQSIFRGAHLRDQMTIEQCCAIEIQRFVRGYMATLRVYEKIYKITLIQSLARRKRAIDQATDRMVFIIQLQATARGFLWRSKMHTYSTAATRLSAFWRRSSARMSFQLDILDILIVQSVARRNIARGRVALIRFILHNESAIKMQTTWRKYQCQISYFTVIHSVILLQRSVRAMFARAHVDAVRCERRRLAAIKIQSRWRSYDFAVIYRQFRAARKIQTQWRRYDVSNMYREYVSARKLQTVWRRYKAIIQYRLDVYSIITVQSRWRARAARRVVRQRLALRRYRAASSIQSAFRRFEMTAKYRVLLLSTLILQCLWRATSARRYVERLRENRRHALATLIQSAWRMYDIADAYRRYKSARTIQRVWRGHDVAVAYARYKAARMFQTLWRRFDAGMQYKLDLFSIVTVQNLWRKKAARRGVAALLEGRRYVAAREIQAHWRGHCQAVLYRRFTAARTIQKIWRGYDIADAFRRYRASKLIQTAWRRYDMLLAYTRYKAARSIQTAWRRYDLSVKYTLDVFSIVTVQTLCRARLARRKVYMLREERVFASAQVIQSRWRGLVAALWYRRYLAATMIQKTWRGHDIAVEYRLYMSARTLQAAWRCHHASRLYRRYKAAQAIQAAFRGYQAGMSYLRFMAARIIQAEWRAFSQSVRFKLDLFSVIMIQTLWRSKAACLEVDHKKELRRYLSATTIQACYRGHTVALRYRRYLAARKIQSRWRGFDKLVRYGLDLFSILTVQSLYRGRAARQLAERLRDDRQYLAARRIQCLWRGASAVIQYKIALFAVTGVQAAFRGKVAREFVEYLRHGLHEKAATAIQSKWRSYYLSSSFVEYIAARKIQKIWRRYDKSVLYQLELFSIVTVQSLWRGRHARRLVHQLSDERSRSASTKIQAIWRGFVFFSAYSRYVAARKVQKIWRGYDIFTAYRRYRAATLIIATWRGYDVATAYRRYCSARTIQAMFRAHAQSIRYELDLVSIITVQSIWRQRQAIRCVRRLQDYRMNAAATVIQTSYRCFITAFLYKRFLAARSIQAVFRCYSNRIAYQYYVAATRVQTCWRRYDKSIQYQLDLLSVITVQTVFRRKAACRLVHMLCERRRHFAATTIQSAWRGFDVASSYRRFVAAKLIQARFRGHCSMVSYRRYRAARYIQSAWRGYDKAVQFQLDLLCVITVQTLWRAKVAIAVTNELRQARRCAAAIAIQAAWRGYDTATLYHRYISARRLQALWRGYDVAVAYRRYLAARKIQAIFRGGVKSAAYRRYLAARKIQAIVRGGVKSDAYRRYLAARRIQAIVRGGVKSGAYRRYMCARTIQSAWRRYDLSSSYEAYMGARKIQTAFRRHAAYTTYNIFLLNVISVQSAWRATIARVTVAALYEKRQNFAAQVIQTKFRGFCARSDYSRFVAAKLIQAKWRGYDMALAYRRYRAAQTLQAAWRCYDRAVQYQLDLYSILTVQSFWRARCARYHVRQLRQDHRFQSAQILQMAWRCYAAVKIFKHAQRGHQSSIAIQTCWRRNRQMVQYRKCLSCVISIQTFSRVHAARRSAATKISAAWRGYETAMLYKSYLAARTIQKAWRCYDKCVEYQLDLYNIVLVQSTLRRKLALRVVNGLRSRRRLAAATKIQARWRSYHCSLKYSQSRANVTASQRIVRAWLSRRKEERLRISSATIIQSILRGHLVRNHRRQHLAAKMIQKVCRGFVPQNAWRRRKAAVVLQRKWRGFTCYSDYLFTVADIVVVQSLARRVIAKRVAVGKDRERRALAALAIQRIWRGFVVEADYCVMKYEYRAATIIQSAWRGFWFFSNFIISLDSAIRIQTITRGYMAFKKYEEKLGAALVIQNAVRYCRARLDATNASTLRSLLRTSDVLARKERSAATSIQSVLRGRSCRQSITLYLKARLIQSVWRMRGPCIEYKRHCAARILSAKWRGYWLRSAYKYYLAARTIQTQWRGFWLRYAFKFFLAARRIQTIYRCKAAVRSFKADIAARRIQTFWRAKTIAYSYKVYISARRIQTFFRCKATASAYRSFISARKLQVFWRAKHARRKYTTYIAARRIQTFWRAKDAEKAYIDYISARRIQNAWRSKMARDIYSILRQKLTEYRAVVLLQSVFRRKIARLYFVDLRSYLMADEIRGVVEIQRIWRGFFIRWVGFRFVRWLKIRDDREHGALVIQRTWRGHHALEKYWHVLGSAIQIQAITRGFMAKTAFLEQRGAACMLQCFVRVAMAKDELARRLFIISLVKSAKSATKGSKRKVTKQKESGKNWESVVREQKKIDRAARTIQRFLAMVKMEVDREVRAEKKRRKKRKMKKADAPGQDLVDDNLLENIWEDTMKTPDIRPATMVSTHASVVRNGSMHSRSRSPPALPGRGSMNSLPTNGIEVSITGRPLDSSRPPSRPRDRSSSLTRPRVPTPTSVSNPERMKINIRQTRDDDEASGVTNSLATPQSHSAMSRREIEEDFELETAFLDAQIQTAKEASRGRSTEQQRPVMPAKRRNHSQQQQHQQSSNLKPRASSAQRSDRTTAAARPRHSRTASEGGSGRINTPPPPQYHHHHHGQPQQPKPRAHSSTRSTQPKEEPDVYYYHYGDNEQHQHHQHERHHKQQQQQQQQRHHHGNQKPRPSIPAARSGSIGSSASRR